LSTSPKTYRVYTFDLDRKVVTADFIKAANDEEAVSIAASAEGATKFEVWDDRRLVAQMDGERRQT